MFPVVEASKLSLKDNFMEYKPQTEEQKRLKKSLEQSIKEGLKEVLGMQFMEEGSAVVID